MLKSSVEVVRNDTSKQQTSFIQFSAEKGDNTYQQIDCRLLQACNSALALWTLLDGSASHSGFFG